MKCKDCPFYLSPVNCPKVMHNNAVTMSNPDGTIFEVSPACSFFPPGDADACVPARAMMMERSRAEQYKAYLKSGEEKSGVSKTGEWCDVIRGRSEIIRRVVRVHRSPLNSQQWCLALECGHDVWVTAKRRPTTKKTACAECLSAPQAQEK